ncbi:spermidine/putrescine ABC transporter permease PotC [Rickettsiella grylli]|uniref:spermidine/putrescine ABC transporter permease PotC n=1 Tax=Rickettsiella grylli TaxID=59196 RepID=UPI0008FD11D8|nr:spermidine/putrescine ABC transporter permease PotC [Rickettsiella grylli]OJA01007.1 spermidine/putrescine ABC transporter permease PotC [Rickettsiella grylli]
MNRLAKFSYLAAVYCFFYFPILVLIIYSFNNSTYSLLWHGFTLHWYKQLGEDSNLIVVALHSLEIGVIAASFATLIGTIAATCLYRYRFFGKHVLHGLLFVLIISPDIVMGISLLILFFLLNLRLGFWSLLLSHITFCIPFVAITVYSRLTGLDKNIFEAARDLGADEWMSFRKIIVPMLWPAILAGWLLSFTLSLDDVIISFFVTGPDFQILPLYIYSLVRLGLKPELNALCSVMFFITLFIVVTFQSVLPKKVKQ